MGYEIKLIIGEAYNFTTPEVKRSETGEIDGNYIHYAPIKKNGKEVKTGRKEHHFHTMAEIDLAKIGIGRLADLDSENQKVSTADKKNVYKWFLTDGNTLVGEDRYGAKRNPVPIADVIKAIEADHMRDIHDEDYRYRRYEWALALLKSMQEYQGENLTVILEAH